MACNGFVEYRSKEIEVAFLLFLKVDSDFSFVQFCLGGLLVGIVWIEPVVMVWLGCGVYRGVLHMVRSGRGCRMAFCKSI